MNPIVLSIDVRAPAATVFALATNIPEIDKVVPTITRVELLTQGPVGIGTRWKETRRGMATNASVELTLTAFEPPHAFTVSGEIANIQCTSAFELKELAGGCRMTMATSLVPKGFIASIMARLIRGMIAKGLKGDLQALALAAERQVATRTAPDRARVDM